MEHKRTMECKVEGGDKKSFQTKGVFVTEVFDGKNESPLRKGDRILSINGNITSGMDDSQISDEMAQPKLILVIEREFSLPERTIVPKQGHDKKAPKSTTLSILEDHDEGEYDYATLVMGVTGVGKSTMCNFFFQDDVFEAVPGLVRVTPTCNAKCHSINGKKIMFIDSPGFSDTITSNKERIQEMGKALLQARNGVHAIIVCLNGEARFTEADQGLINELQKLEMSEDQSIWPYTFVVFTHGRSMGRVEDQRYKMIDKWKEDPNCPRLFLELLDKVQNRFMIIESTNEDKVYHAQKCDEFVGRIEQLFATNNKTGYSHRLFIWAKDKYEEAAQKQRDKLKTETVAQEEIIKSHAELLQKNNEFITKLENEKGLLAIKLHEVERELHTAELQVQKNDHVIAQQDKDIKAMQKDETLKIQEALHKLDKKKQENQELKETIRSKQAECTANRDTLQINEDTIRRERKEYRELQNQLLREKEYTKELKEKIERKIKGELNPETLGEALKLLMQDMDEKDKQLEQLSSQEVNTWFEIPFYFFSIKVYLPLKYSDKMLTKNLLIKDK